MKKIICFLIAISAIVCLLVGCDLGDTDVTTGGDNGNATPDSTTGTQETEASTQDSKLGKYNVVIDSVRIAEDYSGEPIVIVKYIFTNNDDDPTSFMIAVSDEVYQNGVGLNGCYFVDDSANYSADNQTKEIKKGVTIEVEVAYSLNDTETDVEVEVSELISFNDKKISKTFKISDGSTNTTEKVDATATPNQSASNLGNYNIVIDSCRLAEDYSGEPIVIVKYLFTNNDDDPVSFMVAVSDDVFQNGVGLNSCYLVDDSANYSSENQMKEIKKGVTLEVEVAYELNDTTTDIEVEVSEFISFNDKKVTKSFKIN